MPKLGEDREPITGNAQAFPRALPEDCVEYAVYVPDSTLDDSVVRSTLREVQATASKLLGQYLKGFLWQREEFQLDLIRDKDRSLLHGQTSYGDSVSDEWLIVWLLREISLQCPSIYVTVTDDDGQFLLIEAANALPLWLSPEIADFRVWINNGRLLIIPVEDPGGKNRRYQTTSDALTLNKALEFIESRSSSLLHSNKIQKEAFYRLEKFPQQISESLQHALLKIPRKLAFVLYENERYISKAIEAFYLRDPISLRAMQSQTTDGLCFPPVDRITSSFKFTKVGFAQLVSQDYQPPPAWKSAMLSRGDARAKQHAELGMKLSCGFEMLLADKQNQDDRVVREIKMLLNELEAGEAELPTDEQIRGRGMREDDQRWMDIDFAEFERELGGHESQILPKTGFGDKGTQEHLRKIVSRFGDLLKEDEATAERAEYLDAMDEDDDVDDDDSDSSAEEGPDSSDEDLVTNSLDHDFSEDEFTQMMREMMVCLPKSCEKS